MRAATGTHGVEIDTTGDDVLRRSARGPYPARRTDRPTWALYASVSLYDRGLLFSMRGSRPAAFGVFSG
jgi:hypothetical protein